MTEIVYVIADGTGAYKIGKAQRLSSRLAGLQTGNPRKLQVVIVAACSDATLVESNLHKQFAHRRLRGEWFVLTPEDLKDISLLLDTEVKAIKDDPNRLRPFWICSECGFLAEHPGICSICGL